MLIKKALSKIKIIVNYISKEILTNLMETRIVKVTDKGQISLPVSIRESAGIKRGDELILIKRGKTILLEKLNESFFKDLLKHSEKVAEKLWSNKEDDIWDTV